MTTDTALRILGFRSTSEIVDFAPVYVTDGDGSALYDAKEAARFVGGSLETDDDGDTILRVIGLAELAAEIATENPDLAMQVAQYDLPSDIQSYDWEPEAWSVIAGARRRIERSR